MKKKNIKRLIAGVALALTVGVSAVFGGCFTTGGGEREVINGKDLNIYDIYEAAKTASGNPELTMEEFLKEYLTYSPSDIEQAVSFQKAINRSLLSGVAIRATFNERENGILIRKAYDGSGVIIDVDRESGDMTVVTNCHVVYAAGAKFGSHDGFCDEISLWLYGSEQIDKCAIQATIVGASKAYDTAVLRVDGSELVKKSQAIAAQWCGGEESYLGETVYAVGNANGEKISANVGYISKDLERITVNLGTEGDPESYTYSNVLRTSAAINSGNSGGGLFNLSGNLVGLVNAKGRAEAVGVGYALTAASTKRVIENLISSYNANMTEVHGVNLVKHGIATEVSDSYTTGLNDKGFAEIVEEVRVSGVAFGKSLGKIQLNDILKHIKIERGETVIEDMAIRREHNFNDAMLSVRAGDKVIITVMRGGEENTQEIIFETSDFELN